MLKAYRAILNFRACKPPGFRELPDQTKTGTDHILTIAPQAL
jgi:hypothetical protein